MLFRLFCLAMCGWLGLQPCLAQTPADTVARQLDNQLRQLQISSLTRLVQVREALAQDLKLNRPTRLPGLLRYLLTQLPLPDSVERLCPYEQWALQTATGDFAAALRTVAQPPPRNYPHWRLPPSLPPDNLYDLTAAYVARHADSLARAARAAHLPAEDSAFMPVHIGLLANGRRPVSDELNEQLRAFLKRYPKSAYAYVARRFVRYEVVPSLFTLGLQGGGGPMFFGGALGRFLRTEGLYGLGLEGSWRRWQLTLNTRAGATYAQTTYQFDGTTWTPDLYLEYSMQELLVGYRVLDYPRLRVMPYGGLASFSIRPETEHHQVAPDLDRTLRFGWPLTAGVSVDFKFGLQANTPPAELNDAAGFVRLRAGWRSLAATPAPFTTGSLLYAEIGAGLFLRLPEHYKK